MQVEAEGVSFSYKEKRVLESITQGFGRGEIVSIIGPSRGSGSEIRRSMPPIGERTCPA